MFQNKTFESSEKMSNEETDILYRMQEEHSVHFRTWMGYPVYENKLVLFPAAVIDAQRKHVVLIAKTIAKYEPVCIIVDSEADRQKASEQLANVNVESKYEISFVIYPIDDLWLRDSGPIFVRDANNKPVVIDFNFNGWGNKTFCGNDSNIASFIGNYSNAKVVKASLVLEGGAIEVDGKGTAILAESSILNDNRNPNKLKEDVEKELGRLLGIRKIIWVPGVRSKTLNDDLTDYHIDLYAKFAGSHLPGHVFINIDKEHPSTYDNLSIIQNATDANGQKLIPIVLNAPNYQHVRQNLINKNYAALSYLNFYLCNNGGLISAQFGDETADREAYEVLSKIYPERTIEQLNIDSLTMSGGGVHCATQQEPLYE